MKRLLALFALLFAPAVLGQNFVGPIAITNAQCISVGTVSRATVAMYVYGTWTGTLQPEGTIQGQAPFNMQVAPSTSSTLQSTITANGAYVGAVAGYSSFLLCGNTVTSGTANVYLQGSESQLGSTIGGGGGGTAFSAITSGTNTTAAMVLGAGSGLSTSGTGFIGLANGNANTPQLRFTAQPGAGFFYTGATAQGEWTDSTGFGDALWGFNTTQTGTVNVSTLWVGSGGGNWMGFATIGSGVCVRCFVDTGTGFITSADGTQSTPVPFTSSLNTSSRYATTTNCAVNSVSPAACGSASSGAVVIPTTTATYTVNTSAVTAASRIFLTWLTFASNLPSTPTCVAPSATTMPTISAVSAGVSFTIALTSTTGQTCPMYEIKD